MRAQLEEFEKPEEKMARGVAKALRKKVKVAVELLFHVCFQRLSSVGFCVCRIIVLQEPVFSAVFLLEGVPGRLVWLVCSAPSRLRVPLFSFHARAEEPVRSWSREFY